MDIRAQEEMYKTQIEEPESSPLTWTPSVARGAADTRGLSSLQLEQHLGAGMDFGDFGRFVEDFTVPFHDGNLFFFCFLVQLVMDTSSLLPCRLLEEEGHPGLGESHAWNELCQPSKSHASCGF